MRKINLTNYKIKAVGDSEEEKDYNVRDILVTILLSPLLRLTGSKALENHKVAEKILDCKDEEILLEDADYEKIKNASNKVEGFALNDIELLKRINEAEIVEVKAKEPEKAEKPEKAKEPEGKK